ncbi:bifunctional 3-(3-hydroxy-phenyl)propionate/3-hydroxycinnamic acid hydroxylase [Arthrobacter sp. I2-34]|uniref:Bifunctional 3-(3-hydroxy-phenyl)propionate/3-hydroxycinnamic acid hydroxylase n=1 Tax=Arthrobacter hankyongi TaxID=2904801 RepID=A0ABS9L8R0_9MICC|nr:bifunctional 3-(3-hydroxy-phenyl)propionate/3-hydroxycinnamic acid hydroxylase [Arthrobacter hankyongi]MCG2623052.1 bifunctional 3-(3-hydroxy-phenyl)propionate/3-hydroxycinnamic acid hydroxylase [Arthrobacter hankyongi]
MDNLIETDVLVVGAGPVGLAAACLLADQGVRVTVVEKRAGTSDEPRAISITDESLRILAQIGILEEFLQDVLPDTGARYYGRRGQLLAQVRPGGRRLGQPGKSQFDQPVLEALLLAAARERDLIDLRFNTEAFGISDAPEHADTVVIDAAGRHTVRARWVIACDGGRSPVRAQLGIPMEGSTQVQKWIVVDIVNTPGEPEKFAEFHCNATRPAVVVPGVKGRRRYEFMLLPGEDARTVTAPDSIIALTAPFQRITAADIRRSAVYVAHQRVALNYRAGHVLLAGDAAHMMPPFAGQALNAGMRDVANLAWKIAANVNGTGTEALVDTYQAERRPHAVDMVRLSQRIGTVVMGTNPTLTALRDTAVTALGIMPAAKNWLTAMKFLKQPHYTHGCVLKPAASVPAAAAGLVGASLPQPNVRTGDGGVLPLDRILGAGWAMLRFQAGGRLSIVPFGSAPDSGGQVHVTDADGAFAAIPPGSSLVVRPDRYVAAAADTTDEHAVLARLGTLLPDLPRQAAAQLVGA